MQFAVHERQLKDETQQQFGRHVEIECRVDHARIDVARKALLETAPDVLTRRDALEIGLERTVQLDTREDVADRFGTFRKNGHAMIDHLARFPRERSTERPLEERVASRCALALQYGQQKPFLAVEIALDEAFGASGRLGDATCRGLFEASFREGNRRGRDEFFLCGLAIPLSCPARRW